MMPWFKRSPLAASISLTVIVVHASLLFWMTLAHFSPPEIKQKKHLVVKNIAPKQMGIKTAPPKKMAAAPKPQPQSPPPVPEVVKNTLPSKPAAPKAAPIAANPKKKAAPSKPAAAAKSKTGSPKKPEPKSRSVPQQLLQELEESIAKIDRKPDKLYSNGGKREKIPVSVIPLQIDSIEDLSEAGAESRNGEYEAVLIQYLRHSLNLPEYGEVKIQLTIGADGSVMNLKVLKTESEKNRKHLEKSLTHLKFPPLSGFFDKSGQRTFVMTFCNEL